MVEKRRRSNAMPDSHMADLPETKKTKEDSHYLTPLSMPSRSKLQSNAPEVSIGPVRLVPTAKSINSRVQSV